MNLRTKTFFIVTGIFVVAFLIMAALLSKFITNGYSQEENQDILNKVNQVQIAINETLTNMDNLAKNRAEWDDTYQFIQDKNPAYIKSNLTDSTFFNNQLNLIAYVDMLGHVVYSESYNLIDGEQVPIPDNINKYLAQGSPLLIQPGNENGVKGLISLPDNIMLVVSHPILTSNGGGPVRGTIILGRYLDSVQLGRLPGVSNFNMVGFQVNNQQIPADFQSALPDLKSGHSSIVVKILDANNIAGYTLFNDINGQPAYILKVSSPRILYNQSRNDVFYFTLSLLAFGLLFIVVILLILEKMVISRVSSLSHKVSVIGQKGDLSTRISLPGRDEISDLAASINHMLGNLEQSRKLQKESETFSYALLQDSPNPIEVLNPDGSIRYINPALEKITGYSQAQLIGRKLPHPWMTEKNPQQYMDELTAALNKGTQKLERHFRKANGELFWVEITSTVISQDDEIRYIIANWVDITERMQADEALRQSENRFRELAELLPELVFESDLQGKLTFVNRVAFSVFGYPTGNYTGLRLTDLISPEEREMITRNIPRIISGEEVGNTEYTAIRKNGSRFPVFIHASPVKNSLGVITGLRGILVDITTQKEIEAELRASEEFSSSLLDKAPNPIIVINPDSSIRYINPALEKLTGYSSTEVIGKPTPHPWWPKDKIDEYLKEFESGLEAVRQGIVRNGTESCYQKKNGEMFWITVTLSFFKENEKIQYYIGNWVDITAQKIASEQLETLYQREKNLREALQSEIRSRIEYTRALVHELKTPLTPILASSELLEEELTREPLLGLARNVHRGAENMNRRVDELLDMARGEVGMLKVNLNPVDPAKLLYEVVKYMEPAAKNNGQSLVIDLPDKLPIIMADDDRVRQILFNLISNSIKYSSLGGKITITAREEEGDLIMAVQDTGRGMSEEEQEKLFQPYYRIEGQEHLSGLGLGLTLSKRLVELQHGKIWVKSQRDMGSTFAFSLPVKKDN